MEFFEFALAEIPRHLLHPKWGAEPKEFSYLFDTPPCIIPGYQLDQEHATIEDIIADSSYFGGAGGASCLERQSHSHQVFVKDRSVDVFG